MIRVKLTTAPLVVRLKLTSGRTVRLKMTTDQIGWVTRQSGAVAKWLIETFPHAIDRIIGALQRHREAAESGSESIVISWDAGKAARALARLWSTARLDELRAEIEKGKPTDERGKTRLVGEPEGTEVDFHPR